MARPKKQLPPPKNHQLTIQFTKDLYNILTTDATAAGLPKPNVSGSFIIRCYLLITKILSSFPLCSQKQVIGKTILRILALHVSFYKSPADINELSPG